MLARCSNRVSCIYLSTPPTRGEVALEHIDLTFCFYYCNSFYANVKLKVCHIFSKEVPNKSY